MGLRAGDPYGEVHRHRSFLLFSRGVRDGQLDGLAHRRPPGVSCPRVVDVSVPGTNAGPDPRLPNGQAWHVHLEYQLATSN